VPRLAAPTVLIACAASLSAAAPAAALDLPPGAAAAPQLPPGVVVAEHPALRADAGQGAGEFTAAAARSNPKRSDQKRSGADEAKRPFWATVNICDTTKSPNSLGVRTSVPGNGSKQRIFARYTAQWWSAADQEWLTVGGSGVTDWVGMGNAEMTARQAGWTFRFVEPAAGTTYVMRGVVELEWRRALADARRGKAHKRQRLQRAHKSAKRRAARKAQRVKVVRRRTLVTKTGMKGVEGGDPSGLSKAMCLIW